MIDLVVRNARPLASGANAPLDGPHGDSPLVDVDVDQGAVAVGGLEGRAGARREQPGVADDEVDHTGSDPVTLRAGSPDAGGPAPVRRGRSAR